MRAEVNSIRFTAHGALSLQAPPGCTLHPRLADTGPLRYPVARSVDGRRDGVAAPLLRLAPGALSVPDDDSGSRATSAFTGRAPVVGWVEGENQSAGITDCGSGRTLPAAPFPPPRRDDLSIAGMSADPLGDRTLRADLDLARHTGGTLTASRHSRLGRTRTSTRSSRIRSTLRSGGPNARFHDVAHFCLGPPPPTITPLPIETTPLFPPIRSPGRSAADADM